MDPLELLEILDRHDSLGNSLQRWIVVVIVTLAIVLALRILKQIIWRRASHLAEQGKSDAFGAVQRVLHRTRTWFLLVLAIYGGSTFVVLPDHAAELIRVGAILAMLIQAAFWGDALIAFAIARYAARNRDIDAASVTTLSALGFLGRLAIWTATVLLAVANLGIDVTAMIAGLGVGGIAVALAAQNILGDLFASFSIVLDKPFVLGDFIVIDDKKGSVEYIGLKTTRLRSLTGEQLIVSNNDLLKSRIHNYKRMHERRIVFNLGITYETPYEKVAAIPNMLREIIESQQPIRFDRAHFASYGDSALIFEVVYYVMAADYVTYMNVQQAVNLAIFRRFGEEHIDFAYPTRTVHLRQ